MKYTKTRISLALLVVAATVVFSSGCNRGHNDNVQQNGPDHLPLRLQLPKNGSAEAVRILQYAPDDVTRRVEQSVLAKGPFEGGLQVRLFDNNNRLAEVRRYYPSMGGSGPLGYRATFIAGRYDTEFTYSQLGVRQSEGHRLNDGTFERNDFFSSGKNVYRHIIFGRQLNASQKIDWSCFSSETYRENNTIGAVQQLMDDGGRMTQFFDEQHNLTETLLVNKAGEPVSETDYRPDGKTPLFRYDFSDKIVWSFDEKGQLSLKDKWYYDGSRELTVYKAGAPVLMQDWEVDTAKSDKTATPPKIVLYLKWAKEVRQDGSIVKEITFFPGTYTPSTIVVPEAAPVDAKLKAPDGLSVLGSTTPAKSWMPPPAGAKAAGAGSAAVKPTATASSTTSAASAFWTPSGAKTVYTYSKAGYLVKEESYKAGSYSVDKTAVHKESARIKARFDKALISPLPQDAHPLEKPKDATPAMPAPKFDFSEVDY